MPRSIKRRKTKTNQEQEQKKADEVWRQNVVQLTEHWRAWQSRLDHSFLKSIKTSLKIQSVWKAKDQRAPSDLLYKIPCTCWGPILSNSLFYFFTNHHHPVTLSIQPNEKDTLSSSYPSIIRNCTYSPITNCYQWTFQHHGFFWGVYSYHLQDDSFSVDDYGILYSFTWSGYRKSSKWLLNKYTVQQCKDGTMTDFYKASLHLWMYIPFQLFDEYRKDLYETTALPRPLLNIILDYDGLPFCQHFLEQCPFSICQKNRYRYAFERIQLLERSFIE